MAKRAKPKPISYELIPSTSDVGAPLYERLYRLVDAHHDEISGENVRIALAWATSWKADVDGRLTLGKCKKASELDRELAPFDFVILLNRVFWYNPRITDVQRDALLDHELMHAAVAYDETGAPKRDTRGRTVFRIRKHDLEEFRDVVARHGLYKTDLEDFARAIARAESATATTWVSYTALHHLLQAIGIAVTPEVIAMWPEHERRDVQVWARLRLDADAPVNLTTSQTIPDVVAAALAAAGSDPATAH